MDALAMMEEALRLTTTQEVGKVFAKKHRDKLRQIRADLAELIAAGGEEDETETETETTTKVKGKATEAAPVPIIGEEVIALIEKSVRSDGTVPIKLIAPGWGSSGYYSRELLEREGPNTFPKGTHMFWDHPGKTEENDRPERSLRDLAAVTESEPVYREDGPAGPGLYAEARVRTEFREAINELAPHIGTSIRAMGMAKAGEAEGRKGKIIEKFVGRGQSVDFVTLPGRGGQVLQLFESFRGGEHPDNSSVRNDSVSETELREARAQIARLTERDILRDARDEVTTALTAANLPDLTKTRLREALASNPPVKDGTLDVTALRERVDLAVKSEADYLTKLGIGSGRISGMGGTTTTEPKPEEVEADLATSFRRIGLTENAAKVAAAGR